jgi:hypothetical protein
MEIIRLPGNYFPEKVAIAEQFLVPKSMRYAGLMIDPVTQATDDENKEMKEDRKDQSITSSTIDNDDAVVSDGTSISTPRKSHSDLF